jgi:hypothetical protein
MQPPGTPSDSSWDWPTKKRQLVEQPLTLLQVRRASDLIDGAMSEKTASFVLPHHWKPSSLITSR